MNDFKLDDLMEPAREFSRSRYPQKITPSKRREIEDIKERRALQKILNDIDITHDYSIEEIHL